MRTKSGAQAISNRSAPPLPAERDTFATSDGSKLFKPEVKVEIEAIAAVD